MGLFGDPGSVWSQIGYALLFMSPVTLVQTLGIVLALVFMRGRVGPALCVLAGLGIGLVFSIAGMVGHELVRHHGFVTGEIGFEQARTYHAAIAAVTSLAHAASLVLLVVAALAWRRRVSHA